MGHEDHFSFTSTINELLLEPIKISSAIDLILACVILALVAILLEGIRSFRGYLMTTSYVEQEERQPLRNQLVGPSFTYFCYGNVVQSCLHMLQMFIGYILMLSIMTYNAWLFIAVLIGSSTSLYLFRPWSTAGQHKNISHKINEQRIDQQEHELEQSNS